MSIFDHEHAYFDGKQRNFHSSDKSVFVEIFKYRMIVFMISSTVRSWVFALVCFVFLLLIALPATAQDTLSDAMVRNMEIQPDTAFGLRNGSVIVAPIPIVDPTIGNGLVVVAGYLFHADEGSNTSYFGLGAMKTDGGSQGYGLSGKIFLDSNRWQFGITAGRVELAYDLFLLGVPIPIEQSGKLVKLSGAYGLTPDFAIGVDLRYIDSKLNLKGQPPNALTSLLDLEILNVGLTADWDRRDDSIYPMKGTNLSFKYSRGLIIEGLIGDYDKASLTFDTYATVFGDNVIATRSAVCAASISSPFFDSCALGGVDSFRGFPVTQYIGKRLLSFQAAWRGQLGNRFGYSIFGGIGSVGPEFDDVLDGEYQLAAGLGARYRLSEKFPLTFSLDVTINNENEKLFYVYIGQRF